MDFWAESLSKHWELGGITMPLIEVRDLCKTYEIQKRKDGFKNTLLSLFKREYVKKEAVKDISFTIGKGELVGYIGANGAGKSTTIKMLSGILIPTSGSVIVNGMVPYKNRKEYSMKIGIVFGQRSQLNWDLPMEDTFQLYKRIYKISDEMFKRNVAFYTELLDMSDFIKTPIRQLSLGQKMKANLAIAMLHEPEILYLDEPTIGLDVISKDRMRKFIKEINKEKSTTVILTTHDMNDIEEICNRIILIDKGKLLFDGEKEKFKQFKPVNTEVTFEFATDVNLEKSERYNIIRDHPLLKTISFNKQQTRLVDVITEITQKYDVKDMSIKDNTIEEIVKAIQ